MSRAVLDRSTLQAKKIGSLLVLTQELIQSADPRVEMMVLSMMLRSARKIVVLPTVPARAAPGGIQGAAGFRYFTITVGNITQMMQACADGGRKAVVPEREIRPGVRIGIVEDPDGNWVEFLAIA